MQENFLSVIKTARTNLGSGLWDESFKSPVILIFLRHFGCTFCRETVNSISLLEEKIKQKGYLPVFVHMSDPENADEFFAKYFNHPIHHISDPSKKLYYAFGVKSGSFMELFGPLTWFKGIWYAIVKRRGGPYESDGDIKQLSALFVVRDGKLAYGHHAKNASEILSLEDFV